MPREPIPEELRRFLLTTVMSVPFVEALLIFREARGQPVALADVARRIYMPEKAAADVARQLVEAQVIAAAGENAWRYEPHGDQLRLMLELLVAYYRTHLVEVTDVIHSRTARRAHEFADAFRWRKDSR